MLEAYFDESGKGDTLAVAGYVYGPLDAGRITTSLRRSFGGKVFHANKVSACEGDFLGLTRKESDKYFRRMCQVIVQHAVFGFVVSCNPKIVAKNKVQVDGYKTAYTFLLHTGMSLVKWWLEHNKMSGPVAYFFENGHRHAGDAARFLDRRSKQLPSLYMHHSHTFIDKKDAPPLWTADWLAWEWTKHVEETLERTGMERPKRQVRESLFQVLRNGLQDNKPRPRLQHCYEHMEDAEVDRLLRMVPDKLEEALAEYRQNNLSGKGRIAITMKPPRLVPTGRSYR